MKKAFVPICLYSDGFFLKKENLKYFLYSYSDYSEILFLIVDKLYAYNLLIKEKALNHDIAERMAIKRGKDVHSCVKNTMINFAATNPNISPKMTVAYWDDFSKLPEYLNIYNKIRKSFQIDQRLKTYCDNFVNYNLHFLTQIIDQDKINLERKYLFGEIAMSLFISEILGYNNEVWEKHPNPEMVDPINLLYTQETETLKKILNLNRVSRNQLFVSDMFGSNKLFDFKSEVEMRKKTLYNNNKINRWINQPIFSYNTPQSILKK